MNIKVCEKCKHFAAATDWKNRLPGPHEREIYCLLADMIDGKTKGHRGRFLGVIKDGVPTFFSWFILPEECPYQLEHLLEKPQ